MAFRNYPFHFLIESARHLNTYLSLVGPDQAGVAERQVKATACRVRIEGRGCCNEPPAVPILPHFTRER
jgi:hypothetical protein